MTISNPQAIAIYEAYPRKVKKLAALRHIMKAINEHGFDIILSRTQEYAERSKSRDMNYIPYASTFFCQQMFMDDYDAMFPPVNGHIKPVAEIPIWQRLKATEAALEALKKKEPQVPNKWLTSKESYEKAVAAAQPFYDQRKKLKSQLETLNSQLAGI